MPVLVIASSPRSITFNKCVRKQLLHQARRIERCGGLKHNADLFAVFIKGRNTIAVGFISAAMMFILDAVFQKVSVQLLNMVFGYGDVGSRLEYQFHRLGIACNFLFITRFKT